MSSRFDLSGKVAVVTGGAGAIGSAIAMGLAEEKARLATSLEDDEGSLASLNSELSLKRERLRGLSERIRASLEELEAREEEESKLYGKMQEELSAAERAKAEVIEVLNKVAKMRNELGKLSVEINSQERRLKSLEEELRSAVERKEAEEERLRVLAQEEEDISRRLSGLKDELGASFERSEEAGRALKLLEAEYKSDKRVFDTRASQLKALLALERGYEGYGSGVKAVMEERAKGRFPGVLGVVSRIIRVPRDYVAAIEVALGRSVEDVVTRTYSDAKQAIEYLRARKAGRATFLPLDSLRSSRVPREELLALGSEGSLGPGRVLGLAADIVECDPEARPAIDYLLGRVIVTGDLDSAFEAWRKTGGRYKVVTVEGDVISPGGAITGGSRSERGPSGPFRRARDVEALKEALRLLARKLKMTEAKMREAISALENEGKAIEELRRSCQECELALEGLRRDIKQAEKARSEALRSIEDCASEKREAERALAEAHERKALILKDLERLEDEGAGIEELITRAAEARKLQEQRREAMLAEITRIKVEVAAGRQGEAALVEAIANLEREARNVAQLMEAKALESERLSRREEELALELSKEEGLIRELEAKREEAQATSARLRQLRRELKEALSMREPELKARLEEMDRLQKEITAYDLEDVRLAGGLSQVLERLGSLGVSCADDAAKRALSDEEMDFAAGRIEELERLIEELGPVDPGAIEEYARVKERRDDIYRNYEDISHGLAIFEEVLKAGERLSKKRFDLAFEGMRREFSNIFRTLFEGGHADLALNEEAGDVKIIVQPPGKRLANLSLLSAGERALSTIALFFAALRVKPCPFCILDEIDSSLDEANVTRFADLLREFGETSQFIVITHRRATMEVADVLYGVTMEESGISKLISVNLENKAS